MTEPRQEMYQIVVRGHIESDWSEWFDWLTITRAEQGTTLLSGMLPDQTALHGILNKIRDLSLPLLLFLYHERESSDPCTTLQTFLATL